MKVQPEPAENAEGRAALRAHRLRARLGDYGDLLDPLPERPPGMRRRTYQSLCGGIEAATDLAFFGGLEASANGPEAEGRATTGTNQNKPAAEAKAGAGASRDATKMLGWVFEEKADSFRVCRTGG